VGDLRIAGFVGSHQAQAGAAGERGLSIEEKKERKSEKDSGLGCAGPMGQPRPPTLGRVWRGRILLSIQFQRFSSEAFTRTGDLKPQQGQG